MENLTNLVIRPKMADLSGFNQDIEKSHVKSHIRTSKSGKISMVQEYNDKRTKAMNDLKKPVSRQALKNRKDEENFNDEVKLIGWILSNYEFEKPSRKKKSARRALDLMEKYGLSLKDVSKRFSIVTGKDLIKDLSLKSLEELGKIANSKKTSKK